MALEDRSDIAVTASALGLQIRSAIDVIAASPIGSVQIDGRDPSTSPAALDQSARRDLVAALRRRELAISGVDCFISPNEFADRIAVDRAVQTTIDSIRMAADLGRVPLCCLIPEDPQVRSTIEAVAEHVGVLVADCSARENAPSLATDFLGIGIDPAALIVAGHAVAAFIGRAGRRINAVRLSDVVSQGMRGPPGADGQLDLAEYAVALHVTGIERIMVIDTRQWDRPWQGALLTADAWRQVVQVSNHG